MNAPAKLAAFALALAVIFGASFGIGAATDAGDPLPAQMDEMEHSP